MTPHGSASRHDTSWWAGLPGGSDRKVIRHARSISGLLAATAATAAPLATLFHTRSSTTEPPSGLPLDTIGSVGGGGVTAGPPGGLLEYAAEAYHHGAVRPSWGCDMGKDPSARLAALEREVAELRREVAGDGAGPADPTISRRSLMYGGLGVLGGAGVMAGMPTAAGAAPAVTPQPPTTFQQAFFMYHPWIDVRADFDTGVTPAVGNGSTDDTAAFEQALNVAHFFGGGTIFVPLGSYVVSRTLKLASNTQIVGAASQGDLVSEIKAAPGLTGPV